jgi:hypothetical protein
MLGVLGFFRVVARSALVGAADTAVCQSQVKSDAVELRVGKNIELPEGNVCITSPRELCSFYR